MYRVKLTPKSGVIVGEYTAITDQVHRAYDINPSPKGASFYVNMHTDSIHGKVREYLVFDFTFDTTPPDTVAVY